MAGLPQPSVEDAEAALQPVRTLRQAPEAADERLLWTRFREADAADFAAAWLGVQSRAISGVRAGLVLEPAPGGGFAPRACWPPTDRPPPALLRAGERVLQERRPLALELEPRGGGGERGPARTILAQPVEVGAELVAAALLEVDPRPRPELERALRQLSWGAAWLELHVRRTGGARGERLETLLALVATAVEQERFRAAATAFTTELAMRLGCQRASLGLARSGRVRLEAVSHSAHFARRANLTRRIEAAMEEALDQGEEILWPPAPDAPARVDHQHQELAREAEAGSICSVPFARGSERAGVVTLERSGQQPFSARELELVAAVAELVGGPLAVQHREDRWLGAKALDAVRATSRHLVGPHHVALKLGAGAGALLLGFLVLASGEFRVTADATLEAREQRAAVAPFDGYVAEAPVRAGDLVARGNLLALLDDRELRLERARWTSELEQLGGRYRQALSERDAAQVAILAAQLDQARAQLALTEDRLRRTRLTAPFDGVVVTGDLSQQLGAPVQRGQVLFEVAPLDHYRVVLEVDESDIDELSPGQRGTLGFAAFPGESLGFEVEKLTPVSTPREGHNRFRVEARLDETPARLRPGMEGVAKVSVGRRRLVWIWTHEIVDRARLALWNWLP